MNFNTKLPASLVAKKINLSKLITLIVILIISVIIIAFTYINQESENNFIYNCLIFLGYTGVIISISLLFKVRCQTYLPTNSKLKSVIIEFSKSNYDKIQSAINDGQILKLAKHQNFGKGMILEIFYSNDNKFATYQFFKYVPYQYEPCSEIHYINEDAIHKFLGI